MNKKKKRAAILGLILVILLGLFTWTLWENKTLEINTYTITSKKLPEEFEGFRIAQVSDLHNAQFGELNKSLLAILGESTPDIIALTGDIFDSRGSDNEKVMQFMEDALQITPCYFVTGNHEAYLDSAIYRSYEERMEAMGIRILHGEEVKLARGSATISLLGIDDPTFASKYGGIGETMTPSEISALLTDGDFTIALSHRPEYFPQYVEANLDLVLSGHTHGGQIRLPFIGALYAPNQGFFPQYDAGLFAEKDTTMIVSRGIGNSVLRLRFNNQPEVVLATLHKN